MTNYYWTGSVDTNGNNKANWMHFVGSTPTQAAALPGAGDNIAFASLQAYSGPHILHCVITAPMSVNNVRIYASPGVGIPTEILPTGSFATGFDQTGFTLELNAGLTCENFAMCTTDTPNAPIGLFNGEYDKDMYLGQTVVLTANATAWPYLGGNASFLTCTNNFYNNGGEVSGCAIRCGGWYQKGEGNHGFSGTCRIEQMGGYQTIERMRGALSGLRIAGAITLDGGADPAGLTGGIYTFNPAPGARDVFVGDIQIMANVTASAQNAYVPNWRVNGFTNPYIDAAVTENQSHLSFDGANKTMTGNNPVFTGPWGKLQLTNMNMNLASGTMTGYGSLQTSNGGIISTSTSFHELQNAYVLNTAYDPARLFSLIKLKIAGDTNLMTNVDAAYIAGANELYVDSSLTAFASRSAVTIALQDAGSVQFPISQVNLHGPGVSMENTLISLLDVHASSEVLDGAPGNVITNKYTFSGTHQSGNFSIRRSLTGVGYECNSVYTGIPTIKVCSLLPGVTTTLSGAATSNSTNPVLLEVGDSSTSQQKYPQNVNLTGINIRSFNHSPTFTASGFDYDVVGTSGSTFFSEPSTYNIAITTNAASGVSAEFQTRLQLNLSTATSPGPVVASADITIPGDLRTKLIIGGAPVAMTHLSLILQDSTSASALSMIEIKSSADNQTCAVGERLYIGAYNSLSKKDQHDDTVWELNGGVDATNSITTPGTYSTAAAYKAANGLLTCEINDLAQYAGESGTDSFGRFRFWDLVFKFSKSSGITHYLSYYANPSNSSAIPGFMTSGDTSLAIECIAGKEYTQAHYPLNGNLQQWGMGQATPLSVKQRGNVSNAAFIAQGAGALNAIGNNFGQHIVLDTHMDVSTAASASINLAGFNTFSIATTANWSVDALGDFQVTYWSTIGVGSVTWPSAAIITHLRNVTIACPQIWNAQMTFTHEDAPTNSTIYGWQFSSGPWTGTATPIFKSEMISGGQTLWSSDTTLGVRVPIIVLGQEAIVRANSAHIECNYLLGYNAGTSTLNHEQPGGAASQLTIRRSSGLVDQNIAHTGQSSGTIIMEPTVDSASDIRLYNAIYETAIKLGYVSGTTATANACTLGLTQDTTFSGGLTLNHKNESSSAFLMAQINGAYTLEVGLAFLQNQDAQIATQNLTIKCSGSIAENGATAQHEIHIPGTLTLTTVSSTIALNASTAQIVCANAEVYGTAYSSVYVGTFKWDVTDTTYIGYNPTSLSSFGNAILSGTNIFTRNMKIGSASSAALSTTNFTGAGAGVFTNYNSSIIETNTHSGVDYIIRGPSLGSISISIPLTVAALNDTGIRGTYMQILTGASFSVSGTNEVSLKLVSNAQSILVVDGGTLGFPATVAASDGHSKQYLYLNNFGAAVRDPGMLRISNAGVVELGTTDSETYIYSRAAGIANHVSTGCTFKMRQCDLDNVAENQSYKWLKATESSSTVEIANSKLATSQKLMEIDTTTTGFFIYSGITASTTDSEDLMIIGGAASQHMDEFKMYGLTINKTMSAVGLGYGIYFRCMPRWENFHSIRFKSADTAAILISDQFPEGMSAAFCAKNWVFEGSANPIRTLSTNDTYTDYWSMPLSTSNYGVLNQVGNCIAQNVNGQNRSTVFIGGNATGGSIETSTLSAQCRLKAGTAGGEFIQSQGKTYYHMPSATTSFSLYSDWMVPQTGTVVKATWLELNASHVSSCAVEITTLGGGGSMSVMSNGGSVAIADTVQAFRFVLTLPNDQAGITDFSVVDTAYSDVVIYHEHFTHKLSAGDNTENAAISTTDFAFVGTAPADGSGVFPTSLPPLCSRELKPLNPTYLFTPKRSDLISGKEFVLVFGYEDNSNHYVAKWSVTGASGNAIAKLWVVDEGAATELYPGGLSMTLPYTDARCQFGIKWVPGTSIQFVIRNDTSLLEVDVGTLVTNDKISNGQVGWGSRGGAHIRSFNVIERSGLTLRGANIIFQSGVSWPSIVDGVNLYDCTVNTNLLGAFPTYDTDTDTSVFELTSFLTDVFPSRIENFCQVLKGTIALTSDIVLSGSGKLHLTGCIVKRSDGGRWKIDTAGVTYNTEPPVVISSCQLRGIQTTMKVEGKALIVLDDEAQNAYLTNVYARKEMRVKRNRVLGLAFNRNIVQGFDNFEQDCDMVAHNDMAIPGELDYTWINEKVFEFITPYQYQWKAKITAYRMDIIDSANITARIRFTVEEWRTD